jgi:hypothetical protein
VRYEHNFIDQSNKPHKGEDTMNIHHIIGMTLMLALITGCSKTDTTTSSEPTTTTAQTASAPSGIPENLIVDAVEGEPISPTAAKASAAAGDTIVLTGNIAGRVEPFVDGRAMFNLVDTELPMCTYDHCPTPWDHCCETPKDVAAASATVQVVDAEGKTIKDSLNGKLQPGQTIVLSGTVKQKDDFSFVINADQISVLNTLQKPE